MRVFWKKVHDIEKSKISDVLYQFEENVKLQPYLKVWDSGRGRCEEHFGVFPVEISPRQCGGR